MGLFDRDGGNDERAPRADPCRKIRERLDAGRVFEAEALARRDMEVAAARRSWEQVARLSDLLWAARGQILERALHAGHVGLVSDQPSLAEVPRAGCILVCPPLIGAEGRAFRESAWGRGVPAFVLTREPRTRDGFWPIVAVGRVSDRARVPPPPGTREQAGTLLGDTCESPPPVSWFVRASQALGDAIRHRIERVEHPAWQVEDLVDALQAHPYEASLHEALCRAAQDAARTPPPSGTRPLADLYSRFTS